MSRNRWLAEDAQFLDSETTGLHAGAEIVELSLGSPQKTENKAR